MSVSVLLAKYVPDRRRNEPRNVGVLVLGDSGPGVVKFLGQRDDGTINGRRIPRNLLRDLESYKLWVEHWADSARQGPDAIQDLEAARSAAYYVVRAGEILSDPQLDDFEALAERYFAELVTVSESKEGQTRSEQLTEAVDVLVETVATLEEVEVKRDYSVEYVHHQGGIVNLTFQYGFVNGHVTVGQRVLLSDEPHAFMFLGKAQNLPDAYGRSVAFVLSDEFETVKDDSGVHVLLDDHCNVIAADRSSAVEDLVAALAG